MSTTTREKLAAQAHKMWAGWMGYLFSKCVENNDGSVTIPVWAVERWKRQMNTLYINLPDSEKESDRDEVDELLALLEEA